MTCDEKWNRTEPDTIKTGKFQPSHSEVGR